MDKATSQRVVQLRDLVVPNFTEGDWEEIAYLSGTPHVVNGHSRLLRSLSWGDQDYDGNVISVLGSLAQLDPENLDHVERLLDRKYSDGSHYISPKPSEKKITFAPNVFAVPEVTLERDLVAVMMPFAAGFNPVIEAIRGSCQDAGLRCVRADDIWEHSTIIQEIFALIVKAHIVVADFTGRNANVMYETGIAHTLGKTVIPISQSKDDIPFDLQHHRYLGYLPNEQGYSELRQTLAVKLRHAAQ